MSRNGKKTPGVPRPSAYLYITEAAAQPKAESVEGTPAIEVMLSSGDLLITAVLPAAQAEDLCETILRAAHAAEEGPEEPGLILPDSILDPEEEAARQRKLRGEDK